MTRAALGQLGEIRQDPAGAPPCQLVSADLGNLCSFAHEAIVDENGFQSHPNT